MEIGDLVQQSSNWNKRRGDLCVVLGFYGEASVRVHCLVDGTRRNYPLTSIIKVSQKK